MKVAAVFLVFSVFVMACSAAASVDDNLEKMSQETELVVKALQAIQEQISQEGGFDVNDLLAVLDQFCAEQQKMATLEEEIEQGLVTPRVRRSDCKWKTKCSFNSEGKWECSVELEC